MFSKDFSREIEEFIQYTMDIFNKSWNVENCIHLLQTGLFSVQTYKKKTIQYKRLYYLSIEKYYI